MKRVILFLMICLLSAGSAMAEPAHLYLQKSDGVEVRQAGNTNGAAAVTMEDADGDALEINDDGAAHVVQISPPAEKTYTGFIFGSEAATEATVASTEETSAAVDVSLLDPRKATINVVITGSTAGDIDIDFSRNGVDDWTEAFTVAYAAAGNVHIDMADVGYGHYMRLRITDSSVNAGTLKAYIMGRGN